MMHHEDKQKLFSNKINSTKIEIYLLKEESEYMYYIDSITIEMVKENSICCLDKLNHKKGLQLDNKWNSIVNKSLGYKICRHNILVH